MTAEDVAADLIKHAEDLNEEIQMIAELFERTDFLGSQTNLRYAHFGYTAAIFGLVDTMSRCNAGSDKHQTFRMRDFLDEYAYPGRIDVHGVAVQMLRHTVMHTGSLRYLYDKSSRIAYTWRVHFGRFRDPRVVHYTVTPEDPAHQYDMHALAKQAGVEFGSISALNMSLSVLAEDLLASAHSYTSHMLANKGKRLNATEEFPKIQVQQYIIK